MKLERFQKCPGGFSLVELLVTITIIAFIATISVPSIGSINGAAQLAKNQRNAQHAASIVNAARVAGHDFVATAAHPTSQHWVLRNLTIGATITDPGNIFADTYFGLPGLNDDEIYGAQGFLRVVSGDLHYTPEGDSIDPIVPLP